MEQIFMIEVYVTNIVLKVEPDVKDEWELQQEEEERKREEERLAALAALEAGKKKKKEKPPKKPKKGGKEPIGPSDEELKFMETCTTNVNCLPLFDFLIAHDSFVAPPPPPPPPKKGKGKPKPKPKKGKAKPVKFKVPLPSEPLPQPPYFGVGNSLMFVSRPSKLEEMLKQTPINVSVWNREQTFECLGYVEVEWHESFFDAIKTSEETNPVDWEIAELRNTNRKEIVWNTVEYVRKLRCEENLKPSGEVTFYIRLTCLGNNIVSYFVQLPEMERVPGRKYLNDDLMLKDVEVIRHWDGTSVEDIAPVAYYFGAPDIMKEPKKSVEEEVICFKDFVAPFTRSELAILAMGFPKGPCGGTNCPRRMEFRGSQHQFISGEKVKGKFQHGQFVNKRDVHGPCGRLDCPLAKKVRAYLCNEGAFKTCKKPCPKDYY